MRDNKILMPKFEEKESLRVLATSRKNWKRKLVTAMGLVISIGVTCILLPDQENKTIAANSIREESQKSLLTKNQNTEVEGALNPKNNQEVIIEELALTQNNGKEQPTRRTTESISNTYREKLRADLVQLRQQYQQDEEKQNPNPTEKIAAQLNNPVFLYAQVVNFEQQETIPTQGQLIGTSQPTENINTIIGRLETTGEPELPPLFSPEHYLPEYTPEEPVFNGYIWPAQGTFTSGYGWRRGRMHKGIDVAGPIGTPIVAAAVGQVIYAGWNSGGYGNLVKIKHPDGSITLYAHNNRIMVRRGQQVKQGQQIATMGSTGRSTGPHLHFEIHPVGQGAVNPIAYLP